MASAADTRDLEQVTGGPAAPVSLAPPPMPTPPVGTMPAPPPGSTLSATAAPLFARSQQVRGQQVQSARDYSEQMRPLYEDLRRSQEEFAANLAAAPPPAPPTLPPPPSRGLRPFLATAPEEPPEAAIGSLIQGLGLFAVGASGAIKGDARAGLSALTGALKGWHEGDKERADRHFSDWKASTETALKSWENERAAYQDWIQASNLTLEQKLRGITLTMQQHGVDIAPLDIESKGLDAVLAYIDKKETEANTLELGLRRIDVAKDSADSLGRYRERLANAREAAVRAQTTGVELPPEALDVMVGQVISGIPINQVVPASSRNAASMALRAKVLAAVAKEMKARGQDPHSLAGIDAAYRASAAELAALQKNRGNVEAYSRLASANIAMARELNQRVARGQMPIFNRWDLAGRKTVAGDKDVADFEMVTRQVINELARLTSSATGGGAATSDTARKEIEEMLNAAFTPEQYEDVLRYAEREIAARKRGFEDQIAATKENLGMVAPAIAEPGKPVPGVPAEPTHAPATAPSAPSPYPSEWLRK